MVAFGKKLKKLQIQEWESFYIDYKLMKKKVKQYVQQIEVSESNRDFVLKDFSRVLDSQIEKTVLFLIEQEGLVASRLSVLGEQHDALIQQNDAAMIPQLQESYRVVGKELLKLLYFVELNAIGLRKILKKFDKRFGYKFTNYYVKTRSNHPYSQLKQVFKHVGISAVVGTLSRHLADLQDHRGNFVSIYDQPALSLPDPVIESIKSAVDRLSNSTSFLQYIGKHALIHEEELPTSPVNNDVDERYHFMSLVLNLVNTFLYMVNTYIIVPTADDYSLSLGAAATVCGAVIGSMAVAQVFSSVYFSAWSNKSYMKPLIFSSIVLLVGNILYALAYDLDSIYVLLIGRVFCGLGSARAVNRRYISDCVPLKLRMKASAGFVSASALGMACGPALAALLQTNFKIFDITFNENTLPGWIMALAWVVYLLWLWISFKEPYNNEKLNSTSKKTINGLENGVSENLVSQPLLTDSLEKQQDNGEEDDYFDDHEFDNNEEDLKGDHKPVTSVMSAYRLLTPSVKVQLFIYFMLKYSMEVLLAESSVITSYYFRWSSSNVAVFLACLGLTVLPVNVLVGSYLSNIFEERQVLLASEIVVCIGIVFSFHVIIPYSVPQYVCSALLTFVAAEVLEGVNLSLLSRVMSSRLSRGTYNGGLLSTEAGTLARVAADGAITLAGYFGMNKLLNVTLLPSLFICYYCLVFRCMRQGAVLSFMARRFPRGLPELFVLYILFTTLRVLCVIHDSDEDKHTRVPLPFHQDKHMRAPLHRQISAAHIYIDNIGATWFWVILGYVVTIFDDITSSSSSSSVYRWAATPEVYTSDATTYEAVADIWLVGITALELAYGGLKLGSKEDLEHLITNMHRMRKLPNRLNTKGYLCLETDKRCPSVFPLLPSCLRRRHSKQRMTPTEYEYMPHNC